jgi:hypothetical protein
MSWALVGLGLYYISEKVGLGLWVLCSKKPEPEPELQFANYNIKAGLPDGIFSNPKS